jgi:hypothetical protein
MQTKAVVGSSGTTYDGDLNIAWLYSGLNRKMMAPVDAKGNAQNFLLKVRAKSGTDQEINIKTATPTYVTKQAVKSWFRVWRNQFREIGVSMKDLGPYGRVFKPVLQETGGDSTPAYFGPSGTRLGEWTYSDIMINAAFKDGSDGLEANDLIDKFEIHLCGDTVDETSAETHAFQSVGMINSWLDSRKKTPVDAAVSEDDLVATDNPLLLAQGSSARSDLVIDEAREMQAEKAPYNDSYVDGLQTQAVLRAGPSQMDEAVIQAPCGWINLDGNASYDLEIELLGIADL